MTRQKLIALLLTTLSEGLGLVAWLLVYLTPEPIISGIDNRVLSVVPLLIGLYGERVSFAWYARENGLSPTILPGQPLPYASLMLITVTEAAIWVIWLPLHELDMRAGLVFLSVAMLIEHTAEMALLRVKSFLVYLLKPQTIFFTAVEVIGSLLWVILAVQGQIAAGVVVIALTLFFEHFVQGAGLEPEPDESLIAPQTAM